ncbi:MULTISPECIES: hypothetical protein [unclassified Stenotrophomonas maltophilia group]|uniref:hypothetical protein n=1 Tax=unclassified Stenotrophomonas maltophilia group TaxID=2961925 RepID=UPI000D53F3AC|nr:MULTISPECIES: hypothetical protein [unclassified Stenotrophomonas maltophilia group]AWH30717.1 hypothetical protein C1931_18205 [Stenotrophomonas sp. YAU14A_MKIMI4_1]AWH34660.1 hypothetical protein C1930_18125 [Stenotrophomonas sp. SAU14A_NAIMI4_8]
MRQHQDYPDGFECVWLGVDQTGAVAAFVTAGEGDIPTALLHQAAVDIFDMEMMLMELPVVGRAVMHMKVPRDDDGVAMASRGIHVYDWNRGGYVRFATPTLAIQRTALSGDLQVLAGLATFNTIDFRQHASIPVWALTETTGKPMP